MNFKEFCDIVEEAKKHVPDPENAEIKIKKHLFGKLTIEIRGNYGKIEKAED